MKKAIAILLALTLVLAASVLAEEDSLLGQTAPDFTVATLDGDVSLSALLAQKELVVLNIFTSWCPPCRVEFPEMQRVYERLSDRMEIVAVSHEPADSTEVLAQYRDQLGLTFPIGHISGTGIDAFVDIQGYPTTLFINREGVVAFFQLGAFTSAADFEAVAAYLLSEAYDGGTAALYCAYVLDQNGDPVPGVWLNFCTDTFCQPCVSDENGFIAFASAPDAYHVQILKAPEGYSFDADFDGATPAASCRFGIQVTKK
ncbi:MAG: TlpA family protein disulfide reductase [Clostridia bacterium]|nr:TlpA family protein disulfide reductase [Clostridia bacterium]